MIDERISTPRTKDRATTEGCKKRFSDILEFCEMINTVFELTRMGGRHGLKPLMKTLGRLAG